MAASLTCKMFIETWTPVLTLLMLFRTGFVLGNDKSIDIRAFNVTEGNTLEVTCDTTSEFVKWEDKKSDSYIGKKLIITDIKRELSGIFRCYEGIFNKEQVKSIYINVQYPAKILNMSVSHNYIYPKDTYMMNLTVEGNPSPNITFIKTRDGRVAFFRNKAGIVSISIDHVSCTDQGQYKLMVSNQIASQSAIQDIYVYCPPVIDPDAHIQTTFYPRLGKQIHMKIENYGYPNSSYNWTHNHIPITKHEDTDFGSSIDVNVTIDDFGSFEVGITNDQGHVDVSFQLIAEGPPDPVTDMTVNKFTYNNAMLSWTAGFNYGSTQTFKLMTEIGNGPFVDFESFLDQSDHGLQEGEYAVTGLNSSTPYNFTVISTNKNGTSAMPESFLQFTTSAYPIHHESNKVNVIFGLIGSSIGCLLVIILCTVFISKKIRAGSNHPSLPNTAMSQFSSSIKSWPAVA